MSNLHSTTHRRKIRRKKKQTTEVVESQTVVENTAEIVAITRSKSFSEKKDSITTAPIFLRSSNELPTQNSNRLLKNALNASPYRTADFSVASTTRSTDSSPRLNDGATNNVGELSPHESPRNMRFFNPFRTKKMQKTIVSMRHFLADDFLFAGNLPQISSPINFHRCVGGGGVAKIYEADVKGTTIAVKIYNQLLSPRENDPEKMRLLQKNRLIASLPEHPHVLQLFGYRLEPFSGGERLLIAMPFVPKNLQDIIVDRRNNYYGSKNAEAKRSLDHSPFEPCELLGVLKQIVSGLQFLHKNNIIHRDLKSENILAMQCNYIGGIEQVLNESRTTSAINENCETLHCNINECYRFMIADFDEITQTETCSQLAVSSSSIDSDSFSSSSLTKSQSRQRLSMNVGTLQFCAPEMINNESKLYDERVDVWSVGMILYSLFTLELPFARENFQNVFELRDTVAKGQRPMLGDKYLEEKCWHHLSRLFEQCTEKNATDRPNSTNLLSIINDALQ